MDMNTGVIILTFNEDIEQSSVNSTGIIIQGVQGINTSTNTSLYYRLTSTNTIVSGREVIITMSRDDFSQIQVRPQVATQASNTYLSMDQTAFTDRANPPNTVQPISNEGALIVSDFFADSTPPEVLDFSLDLEEDTLTLTFSEPVLINSFTPDNLSISSQPSGGMSYNLTGGHIVQNTFPIQAVVVLQLNGVDAYFLESNTAIASTVENTYLSANTGLIFDTNYNPTLSYFGLQGSQVFPDTIPPSVVAFDFDLDSAVLVLEFNDIIDAATLNGSAITLQSAVARRPMESLMLTVDGATTDSPSGSRISIQLSDEHTNGIKQIRNLCTSSQNCYMTVTQFLALDPSGMSTSLVNDGSAIIVRNFSEDVTPPALLYWSLDMNAGIMELYFSETVDVTMIQYSQLTLHGFIQMYSLTSSRSLSGPTPNVVILLSNHDLNEIKRLPDVGVSLNDSILSVGDSAIIDMNGNLMAPISRNDFFQPVLYISDFTSPQLVSFSFDIGSGVLMLTFSETVIGASFTPSAITFFNGQVSNVSGELQPTASHRLTGGTSSTFDSTVIEVQLTQQDLSAINATDNLATSVDDTYIIATSVTVFDTNGNQMIPIPLADRLQVSEFCLVSCSTNGRILLCGLDRSFYGA